MIRAIGIADTPLDFASVNKSANQLFIRSVRFMQIEPPSGYVRGAPQQIEWAMIKTGIEQLQSQSRSNIFMNMNAVGY